jgi:GDPmannose 4,6-dehydratase
MVTSNLPKGSVFNIGGHFSCTIREMLHYLISQSFLRDSLKVRIDSSRFRPIDADMQIPDTSLFQSATGWVPEYSFEQTMGDLLQHWRDRVRRQGALWTR